MAAARNLLLEAPSRPGLARVAVIGAGTLGPDLACCLKSRVYPGGGR